MQNETSTTEETECKSGKTRRRRFSVESVEQINEATTILAHACHVLRRVIEDEYRYHPEPKRIRLTMNDLPEHFDWVEHVLINIEDWHDELHERFKNTEEFE